MFIASVWQLQALQIDFCGCDFVALGVHDDLPRKPPGHVAVGLGDSSEPLTVLSAVAATGRQAPMGRTVERLLHRYRVACRAFRDAV